MNERRSTNVHGAVSSRQQLTIDPERLVFVGGLHRSGTTPFTRMLAGHPAVSSLTGTGVPEDEGQHLQTVYPAALKHGGSGSFAHAARAHLTESSPLVGPEQAEAMLDAWSPYWDTGADLLVEKSPPNMIMGRYLQACFPGSRLIVVVRHPVAVALSTKKWRRMASRDPRRFESLGALVRHWIAAHEILAADLGRLGPVLLVHYESLVNDSHRELDRVQRFLGLRTPVDSSSLSASRGTVYADRWQAMGRGRGPGGWQRRHIEQRYGATMTRFGYDPDDIMRHREMASDPFSLAR